MQSLINQITSLFAAQSINSIENNGLEIPLVQGQEFSVVFDGLNNDSNPANLAIFNGQALPPSAYTPTSFQVTQLTFTSQPAHINSNIDIQGEIVQTNITPPAVIHKSLQGHVTADGQLDNSHNISNPSILGPSNGFPDEANNRVVSAHYENQKGSVAIPSSLNDKAHLSNAIEETRLDTNTQFRGQIADNEPGVKKYVINESTPRFDTKYTQVQSKAFNESVYVPNNSTLNAVVNHYDISIEKLANKNIITSPELNHKNIELNIDNRNAAQSINPGLKGTQYSEFYSNQNNIHPSPNVSTSASDVSLLRDDTLIRVGKSNNEIDSELNKNIDVKNQLTSLPNGPALPNTRDVTHASDVNSAEISTSNKPIYNVNQYDESKRAESSYRGERSQTNYGLDQNLAINDKGVTGINQSVQNAENALELNTSLAKSQEFLHEIKSNVNNTTDKPVTNTLPTESLSVTSKLSPLDKSPLHVTSNNDVSNGEELAQQITWAKNNNTNHVKIALSPEHLGALEISIDQDRDGLNIQFITQNASAKDAIETFMPRLRDMLEQQGLNLQNANVSQQDSSSYSDAYEYNSEQYTESSKQDDTQALKSNDGKHENKTSDRLLEAFA